MWLMAPYIFDAGTPRERVAEDIAVRLQARVTNDGYFAQLAGIRAWSGTHDRLADLDDAGAGDSRRDRPAGAAGERPDHRARRFRARGS